MDSDQRKVYAGGSYLYHTCRLINRSTHLGMNEAYNWRQRRNKSVSVSIDNIFTNTQHT